MLYLLTLVEFYPESTLFPPASDAPMSAPRQALNKILRPNASSVRMRVIYWVGCLSAASLDANIWVCCVKAQSYLYDELPPYQKGNASVEWDWALAIFLCMWVSFLALILAIVPWGILVGVRDVEAVSKGGSVLLDNKQGYLMEAWYRQPPALSLPSAGDNQRLAHLQDNKHAVVAPPTCQVLNADPSINGSCRNDWVMLDPYLTTQNKSKDSFQVTIWDFATMESELKILEKRIDSLEKLRGF